MQGPWTCVVTTAGDTKQQATQQSPMCQTVMMARHFTAGVLR
jgi:hypothetical protein